MYDQYKVGQVVFGIWTIKSKLGEGSYGKVYAIEREDFGERYCAALKVITVPQSEAELRGVIEEGMSPQSAEKYFYSVVEDIVREFALMAKLKGTSNIVSYEDHMVIKHQDKIGWDILIRMELLTPLLTYAYAHPFSRRDIIRLGIDMCRALELCQKYNIIHRDIKPENIFVSENGSFKLGDFGIARTAEKTMSALSKKGTYSYMAPEVYRGAAYGFSVDTYSLGIVLYRMLNKNRLPFLPPAPEPITHSSRERALAKRMGGEPIPPPFYAEGRLSEIVLKAISFDPKDRYSSPMQMRQELEAILYDKDDGPAIYPDGDELVIAENIYVSRTPLKQEDQIASDTTAKTEIALGHHPDIASSAQDQEYTSRTQGIFSGGLSASMTEDTSRTQSIFTPKTAPKKVEPPAKSAKKGLKKWLIAVIVLAVVGTGAWGIVAYQNNIARQQAEQLQTYQSLLQEASKLYESQPHQAAELLLQAQQIYPANPEPYVSYAYALYCAKEYAQCIDYIENQLALGKQYDISYQSQLSEILGAAYFEQKDYAAAASFFRLSTAGGDLTVAAMRDYGVSLGRLGDIDAAERVLEQMFRAGAKEAVTNYVQAEVDYAQKEYLLAESGFKEILENADETELKIRALRSLAEVYRDCVALEKVGDSPIEDAAAKEAQLLAKGMVDFGLQYDSTLWEMLALAYFEAYNNDPQLGTEWLTRSASAFEQVLQLGINKEYLYSNLFSIHYQLGDYQIAQEVLSRMLAAFPNSYVPYALRCMTYITIENEKKESERDYQPAYEEYLAAQKLLTSSDDATYMQQVESLINDLIKHNWL